MTDVSTQVTAGLGGFFVLFGLALMVWFLMRDMSKRLTRMRMAERDRLAAAEAAREAKGDGAQGQADSAEQAPGAQAGRGQATQRSAEGQSTPQDDEGDPIG